MTPATDPPSVFGYKDVSPALHDAEKHDQPQMESNALVADPERSKSPARTASLNVPFLPPGSIKPSPHTSAPAQLNGNVSSPLTTPANRYRPVSVGAFALGGEAPKWSSVTSSPYAPMHPTQFRPAPVEEDDDDDRPLAAALESKLALKAWLPLRCK